MTYLNENAGAVQSLATVVLILITAYYAWATYRMLGEARRQTDLASAVRSGEIYLTLGQTGTAIAQVLIDHPELRPYFYEARPVPEETAVRSRVWTLAEMLADYMEDVAVNRAVLTEYAIDAWSLSFADFYRDSPALQAYLADNWQYYGAALALLAEHGLDPTPLEEVAPSGNASTP